MMRKKIKDLIDKSTIIAGDDENALRSPESQTMYLLEVAKVELLGDLIEELKGLRNDMSQKTVEEAPTTVVEETVVFSEKSKG